MAPLYAIPKSTFRRRPSFSRSPVSALTHIRRSPVLTKHQRFHAIQGPRQQRVQPLSTLETVLEEDFLDSRRSTGSRKAPHRFAVHPDFSDHEDFAVEYGIDDIQKEPVEPQLFLWEDESTLVQDLMTDGQAPEDPEDKTEELLDALQLSLALEGKEVIRDIAEALVPTTNDVRKAHRILNEQVDVAAGQGLLAFDKACRQMESLTIEQHDEIRTGYLKSQAKIKALFEKLESEYQTRDRLWIEFEKNIDEISSPVIDKLKSLSENVESVISVAEKDHKQLTKKQSGAGNSKFVQSLFSKYS